MVQVGRGPVSFVVCSLALLLAACGGGGGDPGAPLGGNPGGGPAATLTAPANAADGLAGSLVLTASAPGAAAVEFQVDGMALAEDASAPFEATLDTAQHASGQHVLRVRGRDALGNVSAWSSAVVRFAGSRAVPAGFTRDDTWVTGITNGTALAAAPDGRLFVAEQGGALRVVKNGALLAAPFHTFAVDSAGERGLIGVTLHPGFASNGWVYVHYTTPAGGTHNRVSRIVAAGDVSTGVESVLLDLPPLSSATNHNGGALHFGPDGKLYLAVGDNANGAQAQDLASPFGKLLRLNDDGGIPTDNPFVATQSGWGQRVWAYGLRNPFTFAFKPGSARMHINDVGQAMWEEIDLGAPGANYGWPASEGPDNVGAGATPPLFAYRHAATSPPGTGPGGFLTGVAIVGGAFYPDSGPFPAAYRGAYFFADIGSGFVARLDTANDNAAYSFAQVGIQPVDLGVGADGALYVLRRSAITRITAP